MAAFTTIFNSIFPVFFIIALGYFLTHIKMITPDIQKGLNKLAYWVGLPAILFNKCARAKFAAGQTLNIFTVITITLLIIIAISFIISFISKQSKASRGASAQAAFRGNLAFIALPVIIFVIPESENSIIDSVILAMVFTIIIYNVISVSILVTHSDKKRDRPVLGVLKEIITNPLILACVIGILWRLSPLTLEKSSALYRITETLGYGAFPMALLGVGSQLRQIKLAGHLKPAVINGLMKSFITPLIGYFICQLVGLNQIETVCALMMMATPTAVASYVLCDQLECDPELAASSILYSVAFSFISFSVIILLLS